jgi:hypothetical protein
MILNFGLLELSALNENGFLQKLESIMKDIIASTKNQKRDESFDKVCICVVPFFLNVEDII